MDTSLKMRSCMTGTPDQRLRSAASGCSSSAAKSKRKPTSLPPETVEYLKNWMMSPEHIAHPYPTEQEKAEIMKETGIELKQLTNWFVNNRKRYWKPRVEARLQEQAKAQAAAAVAALSPSTSAASAKCPVPVTPTRRKSLIHVVSTPNVSTVGDKGAGVERPSAVEITPGTSRSVSDVSSSSSESGSVGMNLDQDEMSTGQATDEAAVCKEVVSLKLAPKRRQASSFDPESDEFQTHVGCEILCSIFAKTKKEKTKRSSEGKVFETQDWFQPNQKKEAGKRKTSEATEDVAPRPKYRRTSIETWKQACADANHGYCKTLPTMEEAARLFGFAP